MQEMWNVAMQRGWFGPFSIPPIYPPYFGEEEEHAGEVYDIGPFDGLRTASMWAQRFAQIPIVNYAQARPAFMGAAPVFCEPGFVPVPTGIPGKSRCVRWSPPSTMIGPQPRGGVGQVIPPSYTPQQFTYPVKAFWGWEIE